MPKLAAVPYDEDDTAEVKRKKREDKERAKFLNSEMMQELRSEFSVGCAGAAVSLNHPHGGGCGSSHAAYTLVWPLCCARRCARKKLATRTLSKTRSERRCKSAKRWKSRALCGCLAGRNCW